MNTIQIIKMCNNIYMDGEIREQVHKELAPCTPAEFLKRYYELDPTFESFVESEMGFYFG